MHKLQTYDKRLHQTVEHVKHAISEFGFVKQNDHDKQIDEVKD
jgi:hypothetical protein